MEIKAHPIQLEYRVENGTQTCLLCGAEEAWTSQFSPVVSGEALKRSLHMVHLVKAHLADVQRTFTPPGRAEEVFINVASD